MTKAIDLYFKYKTLFKKNGLVTPKRLATFFGQAEVEVGADMLPKQEDGYYTSIDRLRQVFKSPFSNKSNEFVGSYLRNSVKLLNYVYANRGGNGNDYTGDGYKYSGKGIFQLTTKDNYKKCSIETGVDYINHPELLLTEADSLIAAIWYWNSNNLSKYADTWTKKDESALDTISDKINIGVKTKKIGDAHGYNTRIQASYKYLEIFEKLEKEEKL
jgi:putative chitinase